MNNSAYILVLDHAGCSVTEENSNWVITLDLIIYGGLEWHQAWLFKEPGKDTPKVESGWSRFGFTHFKAT